MYSMNYIGKFIANFREFYNDINGATLTGAIDVVVVEQPDGSFTCSPFHVRFGKLGVLRSRFKVVDLELNGEPLNIHMKLGESGEAFFVEEMGENDADCLAHLATSPIPAGHFEEMYEPRRRNSLSAVEPDHGQASDYTKRRYTADGQSMQKPDFSRLRKKDSNKTEKKPNDMVEQDALFEMDGIDGLDETQSDWPESTLPKTFSATQLGEPECEANQAVLKISEQNDFRTIEAAESLEDVKQTGNGKKKKKRKVSSKKKHHRKSSTSSISSQSDRAGSEHRSSQPTAEVSFFSDSEANVVIRGSRSATPVQSDTEVELSHGTAGDKSSQSWRWGELPEPPPTSPLSDDKRSSRRPLLRGMFNFMSKEVDTAGGVYLDDLDRGQVDPDLYFPKHNADKYRSDPTPTTIERAGPTEEEYESGNGPSLPQSPASPVCLEPPTIDSDDEKMLAKGQVAIFIREEGSSGTISRAIDYEEFCSRGGELLSEGKLLVRLGDRYLPWKSAGPLLLSILAFRRPLPTRMIESLEKGMESNTSRTSEVGSKSRGYSWWSWRRTNSEAKREEILATQPKTETTQETTEDSIVDVVNVTDISVEQKDAESGEKKETESEEAETKVNLEEIQAAVNEIVANEQLLEENVQLAQEEVREDSTESENDDNGHDRPTRRHSTFKKTLRLSSDQIKKLRLREGMNEMVFSVTTAYQGTTKCKCNVFRWRYDDKIVISDIDGTITKSDVLGHIFPLVGKDWAQSGVAQLFTKIKNNGYQLLYLSARAIGQARVTREYLRSIKQGEVCLPDGPLLLNPTSLLRAFHREVIEKKPEEFKIQCLADIKALFPQGSNPFYAGYGNRVNDVCAYEAVGIPIVRIFTINYKGELKHELTQTFQSTYSHMSVMVDQVFPPSLCEPTDEFSQTIYWKEPIPNIEINSLTPLQP